MYVFNRTIQTIETHSYREVPFNNIMFLRDLNNNIHATIMLNDCFYSYCISKCTAQHRFVYILFSMILSLIQMQSKQILIAMHFQGAVSTLCILILVSDILF